MHSCPERWEIAKYVGAELSPADRARVDAHLDVCPRCSEVLMELEFSDAGGASSAGSAPIAEGVGDLEAAPDRRIGPYRLIRELGRGGQGQVYFAEDMRLRRKVALKVLPSDLSRSTGLLLRFQREAAALSKLDHPGICTVYETGTSDGVPYIAMRYVEGNTLARVIAQEAEKLRSKASPTADHVARMTRIFERAARALHLAHEVGLVHRDIKPGNIMLSPEDEPVILDFGLVRDEAGSLPSLTRTGELMGTPAYMSPEQVSPEPTGLDRRSDVFSLGVALYEALTFQLPFDGPTVPAIYQKILRESALDPTRHQRAIGTDLKVILETALEKDRARRYQTALAFAEDLRRYREHETIRARPAGPALKLRRWARRNPAITVALVSVFLVLGTALGVSLALLGKVKAERDAREVVLTHLEVQRADDFLAAGNARAGIAHLCAVLRRDPFHRAAAERLVSAMVYRRFALPVLPPLRHVGPVSSAQFSPDSRLVLTASADSTARLWDAASGEPVGEVMRHAAEVRQAGFSSDGALVSTASLDGTARVWDGRSGRPVTGPLRHGGSVVHTAFSSDSRCLATASADKTARLWDARTGEPRSEPLVHLTPCLRVELASDGLRLLSVSEESLARLWLLGLPLAPARELHTENRVRCAAFSPSGGHAVTVLEGGSTILWDAVLGLRLAEGPRAARPVVHCAFSPDGSRIVTSSWDHSARCLDASSLKPLEAPPMRHGGPVSYAEFSPEGLRIVTASEDSTARVWDASTGRALTEPMPHESLVRQARFSPDGTRVVTASDDGTARIWLVTGRGAQPDPLCHAAAVVSAAFSPSGDRILTCAHDLTARVWNAETAMPLFAPLRHRDVLVHGAFGLDSKKVATGSADRSARIWDAESGAPLTPALEHGGDVVFVEFSPGASRLATASLDAQVRVWDAETGALVFPPLTQRGPALRAGFSPDGKRLATAAERTPVRLYDAKTGALQTELALHRAEVISLAFSPDGQKLATCSRDNTARIADLATGEAGAPPLQHTNWVWQVAFSPDSRNVATASADGTARLWRVADGAPVLDPMRHDAAVLSVGFSRDGQRLFTVTDSGCARIWDAKTGLALSEMLEQQGSVSGAAFDDSGERLVALSSDHAARLWTLPRAPLPIPERVLDLAATMAAGWPQGKPARAAIGREAGPEQSFYAALERWIRDARPDRPAHPQLDRRGRDQVQALVEGDNLLHLQEAALLAPDRPEVIGALASRKSLEGRALRLAHLEREADAHRQWALKIGAGRAAPRAEDGAVTWRLWGETLEADGSLEEALGAYRASVERSAHAPGRESQARHALILISRVLRKLGRIDEATRHFSDALRIPPRSPETPATCLDLSASYNAALTNSILMPPELDLTGNDLASLPRGLVTLGGVVFDVRGMVQTERNRSPAACLPLEVRGMKVGQRCRRLHFLHTAGWDVGDGTRVGRYVLRYEGGEQRELPLVMGDDIREFWYPPSAPRDGASKALVAWRGTNLHSRIENTAIWLYRRTWENPLPEVMLETVDLVSTAAGVAPVLVAITVE